MLFIETMRSLWQSLTWVPVQMKPQEDLIKSGKNLGKESTLALDAFVAMSCSLSKIRGALTDL